MKSRRAPLLSVRHKGPDRKQNADMPERHIRITSSMSVSATVSPYVGIIQIRFTGLGNTSHSQPACASSPVDKGYHSTIYPGLQGIFSGYKRKPVVFPRSARTAQKLRRKNAPLSESSSSRGQSSFRWPPLKDPFVILHEVCSEG